MADASPGQKFQELRIRYIAGLPERLQELQDSWSRLRHVSWDPKALAFMHQCAHKLSGSGATFRFPEISETARALEEQLQALLDKAGASAAERQQIDGALSALAEAINDACGTDVQAGETVPPWPLAEQGQVRHRIAVIEDDASQAAYLKHWLEQQGYHVDVFGDPDAWSRRADTGPYQLILLDISFPGGALEGISWLERMRSRMKAGTPVIMMSARQDMVARMRALRAGADLYLTKPLDMGVLEKRICQLLESPQASRPRVLWVDDDADLLAYYESMLTAAGYETETLDQPVRILERIEQFRPDAIVLDHDMPGCQGVELARVLRQDASYMTIPILFVSASPEAPELLEQHSIAGNAFFRKPLDEEAFLRSLQQHLTKAQLIAARMDLVSQRRELRSLQNPDYFLTALGNLLASMDTEPGNRVYYLVQAGIDRQEYLRAQYGARAMAHLQARMEKHFATQLGPGDSGCVLGNGSFLFLLGAPAGDDGRARLERFHQNLSRLPEIPEPFSVVTLSLGALALTHAMDEDRALLQVEKACSEAMQGGGNRVLWQPPPEPSAEARVDKHIQRLLAARSFRLYYQPIVNMETGETLFEALVRLVDEDNVVYLPGQFLAQMSQGEGPSLPDLDRWVIQHAVEALALLGGKASATHRICVKLSSPMAAVEPLLSLLSSTMRDARIKGRLRVYLALSGANVMKDMDASRKVVRLAQSMGCGVMIEHLDASASVLEMIRELKTVDLVKLAPDLGDHTRQTQALEQFLQQLGSVLNASQQIVVTGVEDTRVLSWFWERGIRNFQGYFIQEPRLAMNYEL